MKIVIVEFPDSVNTSALLVNDTVSVTKGSTVVAGGIVTMAGSVQNPPASTLIQHTHTFDAPAGVSGPAV